MPLPRPRPTRARTAPRSAATAVVALGLGLALGTGCSGDDGGGGRGGDGASTTSTSVVAPRVPSFAVGDLTAVDQCALVPLPEATALLHRPAQLARQETMGNAGTCTAQPADVGPAGPLELLQWNVGTDVLSASAYTSALAQQVQGLRSVAGPGGCRPFSARGLPADGLGDGARLLTCASGGDTATGRTTHEVVASVGGHLLLLKVRRPTAAAGSGDDVVAQARQIVARLPR